MKYVAKKKNIEHFFDLNKINEKILSVCEKIEQLEKNYNNINYFQDCNYDNSDYHSPMEICDTETVKKKTKQKKSCNAAGKCSSTSNNNNSFYTYYNKG